MVPAGNKAKRLSSVNHTTKAIHHHHHLELLTPETMEFSGNEDKNIEKERKCLNFTSFRDYGGIISPL